MKKIAVIVACSIYNRKGLFNAVHQRIIHLSEIVNHEIDAYIINSYIPDYLSILKHQPLRDRPKEFILDEVKYHVLWYKKSVIDYFLVHKLQREAYFRQRTMASFLPLFKKYDLICVHSGCNDLGLELKKKYSIPCVQTWHGSDIHTYPFKSDQAFKQTAQYLEGADYNFFVSNALMTTSNEISDCCNKAVLYNGCDKRFRTFSDDVRFELRREYGVVDKKIVGFAGNLINVKNTDSFRDIFSTIFREYGQDVVFWIIGDGINKKKIESDLRFFSVVFWGNQSVDKMPSLLNCIDVLILPSINEGLPLSTVEALACGCHVVGSRVGGIPECIGLENTVDLSSPNFSQEFGLKVVEFLRNPLMPQKLDHRFDWKITARKEKEIIEKLLK